MYAQSFTDTTMYNIIRRKESVSSSISLLEIVLIPLKQLFRNFIEEMANVRFSKASQPLDPIEAHTNYPFEYLKIVDKGQLKTPRSIAIDSRTKWIYVVEGYMVVRVSIFSNSGEFIRTSTSIHLKCPYGIAINRNSIYITDQIEHSVFRFRASESFDFKAKVGGYGNFPGEFNYPEQLTVSIKGDVFVTDYRNNRVQILDSHLRYNQSISHHSMTQPCDVKLKADEVFVLSDTDSHCVHIFSLGGEKLRSLVTCGIGMQVTNPGSICLDDLGNIIISDLGTDQVKIISKEANSLYTIGKSGHGVGELYYPYGIALINNVQLVVSSENTNYGLQIFS